jgi:HSP20 family protein
MLVRSTQFTLHHIHTLHPVWQPPTDVYETETDLVVQLEVAGMSDGHFHLSAQDRQLIVYGARVAQGRERRAYHQLEIDEGDFRAVVELPVAVDVAALRAEYEDGFLRITLPKLM